MRKIIVLVFLSSILYSQNLFRPQNDVNDAISWKYPNAQYDVWVEQGGAIQINSPYTQVRVSIIDALSINSYGDMRGIVKYVKGTRKYNVPSGRYRVVVDRQGESMEGIWLGVITLRPNYNYNPNRF